ncbi:MAG: cysteine desulfurase NifS [Candidatus Nealsonbacteria bacterium CG23_combo_of_CG06-09_8_20_14_all_40_13]|uniref:cysteine desulfurase n=1 Tax=Candidatus Nealsonbacteria bacterium CG23_combo_of_CG06-09_8_20_14_all_40_13 TaxID=1974724 RepID=A0A2G9YQ40_9BACT|nr:MAG: cysteine desulfurase NifS [Candidatus Nealsonbacteria bacterium CG23_combo_of_CG06-09_8_20_14_all_40_13]PIR71105.1 MAG: cysteine desulfurase NifS [Candidatus Nealsonbacteria bacterium CG10_big_fil_rev_8_21_14_0_10_40_24]
MKRIYLDFAATTPVKKAVLSEMSQYFSNEFGNASSIHSFGQQARHAIDKARSNLSSFLNCQASEIIFTSGATESNNLAIKGFIQAISGQSIPHIITSSIEHHSVLDTCKYLEKNKLAEVTYLAVSKKGIVDIEEVQKAIKENTVLISIMYVNNEIGTVQPIREIGKLIEKENRDREKNHSNLSSLSQIYFHTDAVQAIEYFNHDVAHLHVDMLSLSAHKIGGPKGIGALYIKKGTPLQPQIIGGWQENRRRAGTENVAGIVGLGKAIEELKIVNCKLKIKKIQGLRDRFIKGILQNIPDVILNGDSILRSPNNANFCFNYIEGESILLNLDLQGVAASSGSACTSGSLEPSHVIMALGRDHRTAQGSIRFTLGEGLTNSDIDYVIKILPKIVKKLRKMSPFGGKRD